MSNRENVRYGKEKNKGYDITAKVIMFILGLKEEKNKKHSIEESEPKIVYLFNDNDEFESYFIENGVNKIDENILESCKIRTTKKGTIICYKGLCDHVITRTIENQNYVMSDDMEEPVHVYKKVNTDSVK